MDLKEEQPGDRLDRWRRLHAAIYACPKPIVGALERYAIAGGSALALACDFLVVGENARIDTSEVRIGMAATINVVWLQLKWGINVGYRFALNGQPIVGPELVSLGVAVRSVADDQVIAEARAFAVALAEHDGWAMGSVKSALQSQQGTAGREAFEELVLAAQQAQLPRP
jgi:enoyl-CoA hydratase/carnithine racemase